MDIKHQQEGKERKVTVFQGDESFFNKLISRNTSIGCSSRIYYCSNPEGVPFKWEMQPGTPKDPPKEEAIPPLSPPPAVLSLGLPKPNIPIEPHKVSMHAWLKLWKKYQQISKKAILGKKQVKGRHKNAIITESKCPSFELYGSEKDYFMSSSNSSSSSNSFFDDHSLQSSRMPSQSRKLPFSCSPWNISSIIIKAAKRT